MKTKHIVLGALFLALLIALGTQTVRVEKGRTAYAKLELKYASYQKDQAQATLDWQEEEIQKRLAERKKADKKINHLQTALDSRNGELTESDRLRKQAEYRLRQAQQLANRANSEEANQALGVCTDLYAKLNRRSEALERRAFIYAEYADRLEIELGACAGVSG